MTQFTLFQSRTRIHLGQRLGGGGEGDIFDIPTKPDCVAKVYSKQPDAQKVQKLRVMPALVTEGVRKIAAWPLDLLMDQQGSVRGFVMQKITARKDIHELYSPKSRAVTFPEADFHFLVHVCRNIAIAFHTIHQQGHVIGDINHGSILVGPDGRVAIIDCDSFQVNAPNNQVFTCDVGMPLFTAPEIQGQNLRGFRRTLNHDYFGLAVLLFHLLCMGRHPFAGRYSGTGDMPIEKAITESRFAYGRHRQSFGMDRPPGTPPLEAFGASVSRLFEQAFAKAGASSRRPDDMAWVTALADLKSKLRVCSTAPWHHYPNELQVCPWCAVESRTGVRLFGQRVVPTATTGVVDIESLWKAILAIPAPEQEPPLPSDLSWTAPPDADIPNGAIASLRRTAGGLLIASGFFGCLISAKVALVLLVVGLCIWPWVSAERRANVQRAVSTAKAAYNDVRSRWQRDATNDRFNTKWRELEDAKKEFIDLPNERKRQLAKLDAERESRQRYRYLDSFKISHAKLKGIGAGRKAMLASFGIETAADINPNAIKNITGFGPTYTATLVNWQKGIERAFRFNPSEPIDPHEITAMDQKLGQRQQLLLTHLRQGPAVLQALSQEIHSGRQRLMPVLRRLWNELKIAEARASAL